MEDLIFIDLVFSTLPPASTATTTQFSTFKTEICDNDRLGHPGLEHQFKATQPTAEKK